MTKNNYRDTETLRKRRFEILKKLFFRFLCASVSPWIIALFLFITGCASVDTGRDWEKVRAFSVERTGAEARWERSEDDAKGTEAEVAALLSDGLTEEESARIALLNNRKLQGTFEEIGIARADLVQAGLFTNPDLSAIFRFPFGGGGTEIESQGIFSIADFWQVPIRKKIAEARLEETILRVSDEILSTASEAKKAHLDVLALSLMADETRRAKKLIEEWSNRLRYRRKFGFETDLAIHAAESVLLESEAELYRVEKELELARINLDRVLGLSPARPGYEVSGELTGGTKALPDLDALASHAFLRRPDMQMARLRVEEFKRSVALEKTRVFTDVEGGVDYLKETGGDEFLGPEFKARLPLFDQNQARISREAYRLRKARKELQDKQGSVRSEISSCMRRMEALRKESELYSKATERYEESTRFSQEYLNAMQLNMLYLYEAERKLTESRLGSIKKLWELRKEEIEFERIVGGRYP